jgi:uncharacterized protein Veg
MCKFTGTGAFWDFFNNTSKEVLAILKNENVLVYKQKLLPLVGEELKVFIDLGRRKRIKRKAVLLNVYPSLFTLRIKHPYYEEVASFNYSDIFTGAIEIANLDLRAS